MSLEGDDLRHLTVAQGYVELGLLLDADAELKQIDAEVRHVPEVLEVRVEIYHTLKKWALLQPVARKLALLDPQNAQWWSLWAYATRRVDSIEPEGGGIGTTPLVAVKYAFRPFVTHRSRQCRFLRENSASRAPIRLVSSL